MYAPVIPRQRPAGLAVSSLVLGIVGVALSFLPVANNLTATGAVVGLVLGFIGMWRSRQIMAAFGVVLCGAAIALTVVAQTALSDRLTELLDGGEPGSPAFGVTTAELPAPAAVRDDDSESYRPAPGDFQLDAKVLAKQCFGSAGCSVTFQLEVTYTGRPLPTGETFTVVYEVRGVENGPQINNFTVTGTRVLVAGEEFTHTASTDVALVAVATETF